MSHCWRRNFGKLRKQIRKILFNQKHNRGTAGGDQIFCFLPFQNIAVCFRYTSCPNGRFLYPRKAQLLQPARYGGKGAVWECCHK